jgi:hypothetical protein
MKDNDFNELAVLKRIFLLDMCETVEQFPSTQFVYSCNVYD